MTHEHRSARLDIFVHEDDDALDCTILRKLEAILATQAELAADLASVKDSVTKIGAETSATLVKVAELEALIAAGFQTSPEIDAALAEVKAGLQAVDDLVVDAIPEPPAP